AYIIFISTLGAQWLSRNVPLLLSHVLELVSHQKATQNPVEACCARRCVSYILRATIGEMLSEKAQLEAAREICEVVKKLIKSVDLALSDSNQETRFGATDISASQHVLVCALQELGDLILRLGTTVSPLLRDSSAGNTEPGRRLTMLCKPEQLSLLTSTMQSFILNCGELMTEDILQRLLPPLPCAVALLTR
ncbi:hypothetical protein AB205_0106890, partial [Aquarana catesbeiana]